MIKVDKNTVALLVLEQNVRTSFNAAFKDFTKLSKKVERNHRSQILFNTFMILNVLYLNGKITELKEVKENSDKHES